MFLLIPQNRVFWCTRRPEGGGGRKGGVRRYKTTPPASLSTFTSIQGIIAILLDLAVIPNPVSVTFLSSFSNSLYISPAAIWSSSVLIHSIFLSDKSLHPSSTCPFPLLYILSTYPPSPRIYHPSPWPRTLTHPQRSMVLQTSLSLYIPSSYLIPSYHCFF